MKQFLSILLILFLCASAEAQRNFHLTYDFNIKNDFGNEIIETADKGFMVFGSKSFGGSTMGFLKTDSVGVPEFHKSYQTTNDQVYGGGLWKNGYYGFGAHYDAIEGAANSHLIFLNNNGDSLKIVDINFAFNDRMHDAILLADSTFIVMGFYTDSLSIDMKPYVAHIDSLGNILWFKDHNVANNIIETFVNIQQTPDGGYIVGGLEEENPNGHRDLFLLKLDSVGNQEWKYLYNEPLTQRNGHVEVLQNGGYALFGTGYHPQGAQRAILKIDSAGNLIWRQKFGVLQYDEGFITGKELSNGNFICAGTAIRVFNNQQIDDINLTMLDSAGNLIWSRDYTKFGTDFNQYVNDLTLTSDGGFALTGFVLNAPNNRNDIFILKTDGNGLITGLNSTFKEVEPAIGVYPNPTTGEIFLPTLPELQKVEVYNVKGQLVYASTIAQHDKALLSVTSKSSFNIEGEKGLYLIQLIMKDGTMSTAKVMKE